MSTDSNEAITVDETPISPVRQSTERRNSLEKHLQHRPEAQDLKNRHILLDTNTAPYVKTSLFVSIPYFAPILMFCVRSALQAKALELERQRASDNLKKGLAHRPEREELVERKFPMISKGVNGAKLTLCYVGNILPDSTAAPALQGHQKELERHMRADSLEKHLQARPPPEQLVKQGILEADENPLKDV